MNTPLRQTEPTLSLDGKKAIVTGSSSGIGRAIALQLAAAGADVLVHARGSRSRAEQVAKAIRDFGRQSEVTMADLASEDGIHSLFRAACEFGFHIWVNNAGVDVLTGDAASWPFEKKLDRLWQVDVLATMRLSRLAGQHLIDEQVAGAVIINIGWDQAAIGMAGDSGEMFAATKGAVMAFSRSLACSLAPKVRVNCLAPGWIKTAWGDGASDFWQQRAEGESLLGRWGTPADVAKMARFLASPDASFITGQVIPVNGGLKIAAE